MAAGKNTPVFAVLTNAKFFQFFAIDTNDVVYSSGGNPIVLGPGADGEWASSKSLVEILRWLQWFVDCMKSISPRVSCQDISDSEQDALGLILQCFGPNDQH